MEINMVLVSDTCIGYYLNFNKMQPDTLSYVNIEIDVNIIYQVSTSWT